MFTGIISHLGTVESIDQVQSGREIVIHAPNFFKHSTIGDSVANNGVCLTITAFDKDRAHFFAQVETLDKTNVGTWAIGDIVNLEHPLRMNDLLGGHIVQGHVDATGQIESITQVDDGSQHVGICIPGSLRKYVAPRGSITINGISLTVAEKTESGCKVALIPATIEQTTFLRAAKGDAVNIEVDCIARYVEQLLGQKED